MTDYTYPFLSLLSYTLKGYGHVLSSYITTSILKKKKIICYSNTKYSLVPDVFNNSERYILKQSK